MLLSCTARGARLARREHDRWGVGEGRFPRETVRAEIRRTPPGPGPTSVPGVCGSPAVRAAPG
ncbi:hypothetical protein GCM10010294_19550 [Streptomyces griseoloalbus]|nr:hypothetical protein GCM10010294_19550 [Streptomyces griseoloalbus]